MSVSNCALLHTWIHMRPRPSTVLTSGLCLVRQPRVMCFHLLFPEHLPVDLVMQQCRGQGQAVMCSRTNKPSLSISPSGLVLEIGRAFIPESFIPSGIKPAPVLNLLRIPVIFLNPRSATCLRSYVFVTATCCTASDRCPAC